MNEDKLKQLFNSWYEPLQSFLLSSKFSNIAKQVNKDRINNVVIPKQGSELFFRAFRVTKYNNLKVVILGQDPYSNPIDAFDGLAFSNSALLEPQPSLKNILKEVENDVYKGFNPERIANLSLESWAKQGVLLINTAHTVIQNKPESHLKYWINFTREVINSINKKNDIVWLLWGRKSQKYKYYITNPSHAIIETAHPSPLGCNYNAPIPFIGSKCFSKCNEQLKTRNLKEITW